MLVNKQLKLLSVRLPEAEIRAWTSEVPGVPSESLKALQGSPADIDMERLMREDRDRERMNDERALNAGFYFGWLGCYSVA